MLGNKIKVELIAHYSDKNSFVIGSKWPNGDVWITQRQLQAAENRAGLRVGDYFENVSGSEKEGFLVDENFI